jgi:hypothetical protein
MHRRKGINAPGVEPFFDGRFCQQLVPIDLGDSTERRCIAVAAALRHEWEFFSIIAVKLNVVSFTVARHCPISP